MYSRDFLLLSIVRNSTGFRYVNLLAIHLDLRSVYTYLYFECLVHTAMIYDSH